MCCSEWGVGCYRGVVVSEGSIVGELYCAEWRGRMLYCAGECCRGVVVSDESVVGVLL